MNSLFSKIKVRSRRLCNAYSQTFCLYCGYILCFSLYLWIPI
uniref:Photosystem II subunit I n=1 Tax=Azima tetracantha TaxID=43153 RepID=A0A4Y5PTK1_9ROSI|nr:photosystem II subunit I [Azima tetracantha]QCW95377.1 photosystem II subunit I [Azima tetracantha]